MGCQQSKSAANVVTTAIQQRRQNNASAKPLKTNDAGSRGSDKQQQQQQAPVVVVSKLKDPNTLDEGTITESTTDVTSLAGLQHSQSESSSSLSSKKMKKLGDIAKSTISLTNSKESRRTNGSTSSSSKGLLGTSGSSSSRKGVPSFAVNKLYSELLVRIGKQQQLANRKRPTSIIHPPSVTAPLQQFVTKSTVQYRDITTKQTPLHLAIQLYCYDNSSSVTSKTNNSGPLLQLIRTLLDMYPQANSIRDQDGCIPIHYVFSIVETTTATTTLTVATFQRYATLLLLILHSIASTKSNDTSVMKSATDVARYLNRNNVKYTDKSGSRCTPLYRAVSMLPDDPTSASPPTLIFIQALLQVTSSSPIIQSVFIGNASDHDTPLNLLYRRFTRQFDMAEQFFSGDNSRPEVLAHRDYYKTAASTTWKLIELLLLHNSINTAQQHRRRLTHCAVSGGTPPDLLRYIVETNAEDLVIPDMAYKHRLPLHCAAAATVATAPDDSTNPHSGSTTTAETASTATTYPAFYSKYVIDELLYKYPEAASQRDGDGALPFTLAVKAGKKWIGGGIKSLYDAYPEAINDIDLQKYPGLQSALALEIGLDNEEEEEEEDDVDKMAKEHKSTDSIQDEPHDAIMLVQSENVDISEIVTSLWAHEEDAGVQMLGCVAIGKLLDSKQVSSLRVALPSVPAVVNAMKAHPNEVIVQEKACNVLQRLASADGQREISFVASGAVAAIVGAMQAHVADASVQQEACGALGRIMHYGGTDRATIVASVSGFTAILNSLTAHPDHVGVQRFGCLALRELTNPPNTKVPSTNLLPVFSKSQAEGLLLHAQTKYPTECEDTVCTILRRLV